MGNQKINTEKGWTETVLDDDCDFEKFYRAAEILQKQLSFQVINKLDDFDTLYWDFERHNEYLTLHYNIYLGLSLYPTKMEKADREESQAALQAGQCLSVLLAAKR